MITIKDKRKCVVDLGDANAVIQEGTTYSESLSVVKRGIDSVIAADTIYHTYYLHTNDSTGAIYASGSFDEEGKAVVQFLFDQTYISCS